MDARLKFISIYKELKKYNNKDFSNYEIINATKDLIKYSKEDYIDKNYLIDDTDHTENLYTIISKSESHFNSSRFLLNLEDEIILEDIEFKKFDKINKGA